MSIVNFELANDVAVITLDDGKVNVINRGVIDEIHTALDKAAEADVPVVFTGRQGIFSAGFDLKALESGGDEARLLVRDGALLAKRFMSFERPIVSVCTGHAYPMGAFLLMSSDYRVGVSGEFSMGLNEVAIGLTVPLFAVELARYRLNDRYFHRTVITGELYNPEQGVDAGFLDEVVSADLALERGKDIARKLSQVDYPSYEATKVRAAGGFLSILDQAIEEELI